MGKPWLFFSVPAWMQMSRAELSRREQGPPLENLIDEYLDWKFASGAKRIW